MNSNLNLKSNHSGSGLNPLSRQAGVIIAVMTGVTQRQNMDCSLKGAVIAIAGCP
jgi:hypothetical protein